MASVEVFTWEDFDKAVGFLTHQVIKRAGCINSIYGIPRGGLILAVVLSHRLHMPLLTSPSEVNAFTLIVDDICDTGKTLLPYRGHTIATIHYVPKALIKPDFYVHVRAADWVEYPWECERVATGKR